MTRQLQRVAVLILGWLLIVLGVVGLFLPVLQGFLFLALGLFVLSRESKWARHLFDKLRARYPEVDRRVQSIRRRWRGKRQAEEDLEADSGEH